MLLEVEGLCVNYGHIQAIRDITFGVEEGEITTLIAQIAHTENRSNIELFQYHRTVYTASIRFNF